MSKQQRIATAVDWLRHRQQQRRMSADQALGRRGEDLAHRYLRRQGFTIVARNYRLAAGDAEADIIAREGEELVIVEVKTRRSEEFGPPERAIGPEKQRHLVRVAREYAKRSDTPPDRVRFDVVTVVIGQEPQARPEIALLRRGFSVRI